MVFLVCIYLLMTDNDSYRTFFDQLAASNHNLFTYPAIFQPKTEK